MTPEMYQALIDDLGNQEDEIYPKVIDFLMQNNVDVKGMMAAMIIIMETMYTIVCRPPNEDFISLTPKEE